MQSIFLFLALNEKNAKEFVSKIKVGGAVPTLSQEELKKLPIRIPCRNEQQKIADFLSTIDSIISSQKEELAAWEQRKKGVMQKLFSQEVRFKADDGSEFPEWEEKNFKEITYPSGEKNKNNGNFESYSITNEKGFVKQDEQFEGGNYKNADKSMYIIVNPGSFAYNPARINVGSIGYQNLSHDVIISSLYEVFNTKDNVSDSFLWEYFQSDEFKSSIKKYSEGGVRSYFFYDKLCQSKIILPSLPEQQKIADCLSCIDEVIKKEKEELEKWQELKKGLLQQMFV